MGIITNRAVNFSIFRWFLSPVGLYSQSSHWLRVFGPVPPWSVPLERHRRLHLLKYGKLPAQASPSVHSIGVWETPCWRDIHLSILESRAIFHRRGNHGKLLSSKVWEAASPGISISPFQWSMGESLLERHPSVHSTVIFRTSMSSPLWRHATRVHDIIPKVEVAKFPQ